MAKNKPSSNSPPGDDSPKDNNDDDGAPQDGSPSNRLEDAKKEIKRLLARLWNLNGKELNDFVNGWTKKKQTLNG